MNTQNFFFTCISIVSEADLPVTNHLRRSGVSAKGQICSEYMTRH